MARTGHASIENRTPFNKMPSLSYTFESQTESRLPARNRTKAKIVKYTHSSMAVVSKPNLQTVRVEFRKFHVCRP